MGYTTLRLVKRPAQPVNSKRSRLTIRSLRPLCSPVELSYDLLIMVTLAALNCAARVYDSGAETTTNGRRLVEKNE